MSPQTGSARWKGGVSQGMVKTYTKKNNNKIYEDIQLKKKPFYWQLPQLNQGQAPIAARGRPGPPGTARDRPGIPGGFGGVCRSGAARGHPGMPATAQGRPGILGKFFRPGNFSARDDVGHVGHNQKK